MPSRWANFIAATVTKDKRRGEQAERELLGVLTRHLVRQMQEIPPTLQSVKRLFGADLALKLCGGIDLRGLQRHYNELTAGSSMDERHPPKVDAVGSSPTRPTMKSRKRKRRSSV